jgi:hypothetical protein
MQGREDAGQTMERLTLANPNWSACRIAEQVRAKDYRRIAGIIRKTRWQRCRAAEKKRKLICYPLLAGYLLLDAVVYSMAVSSLKRGKFSRIWNDTRTTDTEVAR